MDSIPIIVISVVATTIFWAIAVNIDRSRRRKYAEITFMDGSKRSSQIEARQFGTIYTDFGTFRADENGIWRSDIHSEITLKVL